MAPKPVSMPNPEYTDRARKKKLNGSVMVAMIVTPEGKVRDLKVTKSLDKDLDKQALAAVSTWKSPVQWAWACSRRAKLICAKSRCSQTIKL